VSGRPLPDLAKLVEAVDARTKDAPAPDTIPTGFPSLDQILGGGLRRQDFTVLGGDVGAGKSALALAVAIRIARGGTPVAFLSGEMNRQRLLERALVIEGRATVDELRSGSFTETTRASLGAAALKLQDLPIRFHPILEGNLTSVFATAMEPDPPPGLAIVDYLQLIDPPSSRLTQAEDHATIARALKSLALDRDIAVLAVTQLADLLGDRPDPRPNLSDFGAVGAIRQHADIVLGLYREEMYAADRGVEGAAELLVLKNRNGPTAFVDLYFHKQWMRFEDMLDR
jgi:replicative DNA helicase